MRQKLLPIILTFFFLGFFTTDLKAQTTIVGWNFFINGTANSGIAGNSGVTTFSTASAFFSGVGCGFQEAVANSGWTTAGKAWTSSSFTTVGYNTMNVTFKHSSYTGAGGVGPTSFKFQYKVGAGSWTDIGGAYSITLSGGCGFTTVTKTLPAACNNQSSVFIRTVSQNTGNNGVGNRVAELQITGTAIGACSNTFATISPDACNTYTSPSGKVWTMSNTYMDTIPNAAMCDSIITINLTINPNPVADFSTANVCDGVAARFFNGSSIATGSYSSAWDFDDGNSSTDHSPSHTYGTFGSYDVELTVTSNKGCTDVVTKTIQIYAKPIVDFTMSNECEDTDVSTVNLTTGASTYAWSFGDGSTSTATNPTHTFTKDKIYTVRLEATSVQGCKDETAKQVVIHPNPVAKFTTRDVCDGESASFTNGSSIGGGSYTSAWTFGDGNSSSAVSPNYSYGTFGNYYVKLKLTSDSGCSDSVTKAIVVSPTPVADFTTMNVCDGVSARFTNGSSIAAGSYTSSWDFDDGNGSSDHSPSHTYGTFGLYDVELSLTSNKGCTDAVTKRIQIYAKPVVDFTMTNECEDVAVSAVNLTTGGWTYAWSFGDGGTSTATNPTYTFIKDKTYTVRLEATSVRGCKEETSKQVVIHPNPIAKFTTKDICETEAASFTNGSSIGSGRYTSSWSLGDGNSSMAVSPNHRYGTFGSYYVELSLTSDSGCTDAITKSIVVSPTPVADFSTMNVCDGVAARFTNGSSIAAGSYSSEWDFDNGVSSMDHSPSYEYTSFGRYDVELVVTSNKGCTDAVTKNIQIYAKPIVKFTMADECEDTEVAAVNLTTGARTYAWSFGDGSTSTATNPTHTFTKDKTYTVRLEATSVWGCTDEVSRQVTIHPNPVAKFTTKDVCDGTVASFTNGSSIGSGRYSSSWSFGDGNSSTTNSPKHTYGTFGRYYVALNMTSSRGCTDSITKAIVVSPTPVADFSTMNVCDGVAASFTNGSSIAAGSYTSSWDFDDGNTSTDHSPIHGYGTFGSYDVELSLRSNKGCTDEVTKTIQIYAKPIVDFTMANECEGIEVSAVNLTTGASTYAWSFGDGGTSIADNPTYTFANDRTYTVRLEATSVEGCKDEASRQVTIYPSPIVGVSADAEIGKGIPLEIKASGGLDYEWTPAIWLDNPFSATPIAKVDETTEFEVIITDGNNCKDTGYVNITAIDDYKVFPVNTLTPNGDGVNDKLFIENLYNYPNNTISVLDRWGREVYRKEAYNGEWDGTQEGSDLPSGTYYYILYFGDGTDAVYKGSVTLVRNK